MSGRSSRLATTTWPARRSPGGDAALWVACAMLAATAAALVGAGLDEPGPRLLILAMLAALLALGGSVLLAWALAYRRLVYTLTDGGLRVRWLAQTVVLPYSAIDGIYTGQRLVGHASPSVPRWPGIHVGPGRVRGIGRLRFFATSPDPAALTLITVEHGGLVLSARNPHDFRAALIERVEDLPPDAPPAATWQDEPIATWSALVDRWLWLSVAAALVLLLAGLILIVLGLPGVGEQTALHFDANGQPNQIGPKADLLRLPALGLLLVLVDVGLGIWLHAHDAVLARVLWVCGALVQVVLLVALVRLLQ